MFSLFLLALVFTVALVWYIILPLFEKDTLTFKSEQPAEPVSRTDLEEDFQTGKLSSEDYQRLKGNL